MLYRFCNKHIKFDPNVKSASNKFILLSYDIGEKHTCSENAYHKNKYESSNSSMIKTTAATIKETEVATADLLVSFAEQNSYLYFNIHTQLRELLRRRKFLKKYDIQNH